MKVWDVFGRNPSHETYTHLSDVLAVAYRPDGKELCASTMKGELQVRGS